MRGAHDEHTANGDLGHASTAAGHRGLSCLQLGRLEDARRCATECRELSSSDDVVNQYLWRSVEAALLGREGRFDEADRLLEEADRWASQTDEFIDRIWLAMIEADIRLAEDRPGDARAALDRSLALAEAKGSVTIAERVRARSAEL